LSDERVWVGHRLRGHIRARMDGKSTRWEVLSA
jgi:hypothetical protein